MKSIDIHQESLHISRVLNSAFKQKKYETLEILINPSYKRRPVSASYSYVYLRFLRLELRRPWQLIASGSIFCLRAGWPLTTPPCETWWWKGVRKLWPASPPASHSSRCPKPATTCKPLGSSTPGNQPRDAQLRITKSTRLLWWGNTIWKGWTL